MGTNYQPCWYRMNRRGLVLIVSLTAHVWAGTPSLESCPGVLFLSASELNATTTANDMLPGQCIGEPRHLSWVNVNDFGLGCWDAEQAYGVVGTPGGDFAEFLNGLNAFEKLSGMPLQAGNISAMMLSYLGKFPTMTMCNSESGLKNLLGSDFDSVESLQSPPTGFNASEAARRSADGVKVGDRYLTHMMGNFKSYNIRLGLVKGAIRAYFKLMWSESAARYNLKVVSIPPSQGPANAILRVHVPQMCAERGATPLIKPTREATMTKAFVTNVDAVRQHRERIAAFFAVSDVHPVSSEDLMRTMTQTAAAQFDVFTSEALPKMPVFDVNINY